MAKRADWMPHVEAVLVLLMTKWKAWLSDTAKQTAFAWEAAACEAVVSKIDDFLAALEAYQGDDSSVNLLAKNEAKKAAVAVMRDFAKSSVRFNPKMTDADRLVLGIRPADTTPTNHPVPTSQPDTDVLPTTNHYEHKVRALNHALGDTSKPADAYGVRYAWQVGGERPASGEDLPKTKFTRRTTYVVGHTEADKGKTVWYATCYENGRGDPGRWSPVTDAVIA
jgi:hypothetical protein